MLADDLEFAMKNEQKIRLAVAEKRHDRCTPSGGGHSGISRPTEMQALKNLEPVGTILVDGFVVIREPERILDVVRRVKIYFNDKPQGALYRMLYIYHEEDYKVVCSVLRISKSTYYNYHNQIMEFAEKEWNRSENKSRGPAQS